MPSFAPTYVTPEMVASAYSPQIDPTQVPPPQDPAAGGNADALLQALISLGAIPEEQALLMRQANQGQSMQDMPNAQGQRVGGTYVAASPLEHLSVAFNRVMGANKQRDAEEAYRASLEKQTAGRGDYAAALLKALNGGY